jgi:hypothetical protein
VLLGAVLLQLAMGLLLDRDAIDSRMARALAMFVLSQVACGRGGGTPPRVEDAAAPTPSTDTAPFSLVVYGEGVGVIYQYDALVAALAARPPTTVAFELGPDDVEQFVIGPEPSGRYNLVLAPAASERWRVASPKLHDTVPFEVKLGDRRLFVGVIYTPIGAAYIRTPVLHRGRLDDDERGVLTVSAYLGAAFDGQIDATLAARIDSGELRAYFARRGVLQVLAAPPAFRPDW